KVDIKHLHIDIATDTLFFEQIAKLRSLRKTLPLILNQYDCKAQVHLHASNSNTYRSEYDSYSNLLRDTLAGMAAIIGGADSLYIPPFDLKKLSDNEFSRRLSLNQQLIFKEESYLNKVADSSTGSYAIEQLTHDIAEKSWKLFQQIEEEGRFQAAGNKVKIQATIQQQAQELVEAYRSGKKILVGVNKFPDPMDQPQEKRANPQRTSGLTALNLADALLYKH